MKLDGNIKFTSTGKALATKTKDAIKGDSWYGKEKIEDTFEKTASSKKTSPSEKAIADFGKRLGGSQYYASSFADANYNVLLHLAAGSVEGPVGAALAKIVLSASQGARYQDPRTTIVDRGLHTIADHCQDSNDGQVAALGHKFSRSPFHSGYSESDASTLQMTTLNTIINGSQGETGQVLANLTKDAAKLMTDRNDPKWLVLKDGLDSIADSPTADADHKLLATLGKEYSNPWVSRYHTAHAQAEVVELLSGPMTGSMTDRICDLSLKVGNCNQVEGAARAFLEDGFEAILANPTSTIAEKKLARKGVEITDNDNLGHVSAAQQSLKIMEQLKAVS